MSIKQSCKHEVLERFKLARTVGRNVVRDLDGRT
jgi:hypothetical protein